MQETIIKSEYDFSKAEQGKFSHSDAKLHYPINKEPDPSSTKHYPLRGMPITIAADFDEPMPELWTLWQNDSTPEPYGYSDLAPAVLARLRFKSQSNS